MARKLTYWSNFPPNSILYSVVGDLGELVGTNFVNVSTQPDIIILKLIEGERTSSYLNDEMKNSPDIDILLLKETDKISAVRAVKIINERCLAVIGYFNDTLLEGQEEIINILKKYCDSKSK